MLSKLRASFYKYCIRRETRVNRLPRDSSQRELVTYIAVRDSIIAVTITEARNSENSAGKSALMAISSRVLLRYMCTSREAAFQREDIERCERERERGGGEGEKERVSTLFAY